MRTPELVARVAALASTAIWLLIWWALWPAALLAQQRFPTTPVAINERKAELQNPASGLPDNQVLIEDEIRRLGDEREQYRAQLVSEHGAQASLASVDSIRAIGVQAINAARKLDCTHASDRANAEILAALGRIDEWSFVRELRFASEITSWATLRVSAQDYRTNTTAQFCAKVKAAFADTQTQTQLLNFFDQARQHLQTQAEQERRDMASIRELIDLIDKRRVALQDKLRGVTTQQRIGANLWAVILAIGVLSIGTIVVVKLFPNALQIEWVASGQVIQFVTVMVS